MITSNIYATDISPHQKILQLLEASKYKQAYLLSNEALNDWEGDVQFDFAFALAAKSVGDHEQAIFAFERVIANEPSSVQARYFLAVTYFEIDNLIAAQLQFTLIENHPENTQYANQTKHYLDAITHRINRKSSHWKNFVKLSVGSDSNANNGIKDELIHVPLLGDVRLFEQSQKIKSNFTDAQIQLLYISPQDQQSAWYTGIDVQKVNYDKTFAWSRTFLGATAGYKSKWQVINWDLSLFYRSLSLDNDDYLDYTGLSANFSYEINDSNDLGVMLLLAKENYGELPELDKNQSVASIWFSNKINQRMIQKIDVRFGVEDALEKGSQHIERNIWGMGYQYNWQLNSQWGLLAKLDYLKTNHQSVQPLFNVVRKDNLLRTSFNIEYRLDSQWRVSLTANHMRNSSNIILYDYDRNKLQLSIKYRF